MHNVLIFSCNVLVGLKKGLMFCCPYHRSLYMIVKQLNKVLCL